MFGATPPAAESLTITTFAAPLSRDGPGLLLRDLINNNDPQLTAVQDLIAQADAEILVLTDFDYDAFGYAASALIANLEERGALYPHHFAIEPNSGLQTGYDLDQNGKFGEPRDAQGYGRFLGDGGILILSRCPLSLVEDYSKLLWRDFANNRFPPETPEEIKSAQRLSSSVHLVLNVDCTPQFALAVFAATPPVFDGPEQRNDRRNADEISLWTKWVEARSSPFVIAGNANLDPNKGEGYREAMQSLLSSETITDPLAYQDTAFWPTDFGGTLRVSYVLPSRDFEVVAAGVMHTQEIGPHGFVWAKIALGSEENRRTNASLSP